VYLQTRAVIASECISEFTRSKTPSACPNSINYGLQVPVQTRSITASKCISAYTPSRPPSACPNALDDGFPVHLQTRSIKASMCILIHWILASKCVSKLARSRPPSTLLKRDGRCLEIQGKRRWNQRLGVYSRETPGYIDSISFSSHLVIQPN
jgi:hypothetical protein